MQLENLYIYKLLSDVGLLVLIWLVQLVIYPSFKYYTQENLKKWHEIYTSRITFVVLPLMLSQITLSIILLLKSDWDFFHIVDFILVLLTWISTFIVFVPLHQNIDRNKRISKSVFKLIKYNWFRTLLWSFIAILTFFKMLT